MIICEVTASNGENIVQALDEQLNAVWGVNEDTLDDVKLNRKTLNLAFVHFNLDIEQESTELTSHQSLSCYAWDEYHSCLAIALNGSVIRIFYESNLKSTISSTSRGPSPEISSNRRAESTLKIIWGLDIESLEKEKPKHSGEYLFAKTDAGPKVSDSLFSKPQQKKQINANAKLQDDALIVPKQFKRRSTLKIQAPPTNVIITSMKCLVDPEKRTPQIILSCDDGTIRLFKNENYQCEVKPTIFYTDRDLVLYASNSVRYHNK